MEYLTIVVIHIRIKHIDNKGVILCERNFHPVWASC